VVCAADVNLLGVNMNIIKTQVILETSKEFGLEVNMEKT
jgi:hypothetical protein